MTIGMGVYRELLVDENTRKVELRYIDEATGREITGMARSLQGFPAAQRDLALFICGGFLADRAMPAPPQLAQPSVSA